MKRKFVTNLILLIFLNILIKPFYVFGIERTVQNVVGDQSFGLYFALFNFSVILNILLDVGINNFNNRNIAQHNFLLTKHLSNIIGLKFVLSLFYAFVCLIVAFIIGYDKVQFQLLFFLIFNQFLISFILYLRSNISALHFFRTDSLISVLDRSIMIIICGILLFTNILKRDFTIEMFVYAQTASYLLTVVVTFLMVLSKSGKITIRFNRRFFLVFLKKSYPYAILIFLMAFYNRIDSVLIERLLPGKLGDEQAGIYAQAFRLLDVVANFGFLVAGLLLPIFAKMIKDRENVGSMVHLSHSLIIVPAIVVAVSCVFYNKEIMQVLYHSNSNESARILGILMIGLLGIMTSYIFGTLLTANGSLKQLNIMASAGMVLNIVLNIILIPKFLALGSAYASLTTQFITAVAQMAIAVIIFKLEINWKYILRLAAFVILVVFLGFLTAKITNWFYGFATLVGVSVLTAFLIKLISLKNLFNIIFYKK
ncbi:MAG: oligosaccharide flippase family protein [Prolixibacteraceae bacterium]|nr:oligosaccharide flippase family protein [Prolixibacteraceae bacterium]MBN2775395.1 oligosaccharide flippase family protein [Prolixibacteraceae bacterium]